MMIYEISSAVLLTTVVFLSFFLYRAIRKDPDKILLKKLADANKELDTRARKISDLSHELRTYKRERLGLVAKWLPPKEDESAFVLSLYNDNIDKAFNISLIIPDEYRGCLEINVPKHTLKPETEFLIHVIPNRKQLTQKWIEKKFEPIPFTIQYTDNPSRKNPQTLSVPFKVANTAAHFRSWLKISAKGKLD